MKKKAKIPKLKLQFKSSEIEYWAKKYQYDSKVRIEQIASEVKKQGYLTRDQLILICEWKTPRSKRHVLKNSEDYVFELSKFALSAKDERCRIETLTLLSGVSWPSASVILHFCHKAKYPILDFRALESFGIEDYTNFNFAFWWKYVDQCRLISEKEGLDMRTIDMALWQYSKEKSNLKDRKK